MLQTVSRRDAKPSKVGDRVERTNIARFLRGRGRYVADIVLPRMLHLVFVRSPYAYARIVAINSEAALRIDGVKAVVLGSDLQNLCRPLEGVAANRVGHKAPPQPAMAIDVVHWQGQPFAAVVADTRAVAEDAVELIEVEWEPFDPILDGREALAPGARPLHAGLSDNLAFEHTIRTGDPDKALAGAAQVIACEFKFERQTGLTLEPRGLIADYDVGSEMLTVHHSHQSPFQMQEVFSRHLGIPESKVRVIAPDVGGGFGIKINTYAEEVAVAAVAVKLGRPVKYCADRIESFSSDVHVRDHEVSASIAVDADGSIAAFTVDDISSIGAFGMHLRFNVAESMMLLTNMGAPYRFANYLGHTRNAYVNKNLIGMYRGVGIPLSCVASEVLVDFAARKVGIDPLQYRRQILRKASELPCVTPGGSKLTYLSLPECLDRLESLMGYSKLREEQAELRKKGVYRGIGLSVYIEPTAYGPPYYGPTGASITSQDGCSLRLDPSGAVRCVTSITDQGQGTLTGIAQIVSETLSIPIDSIDMISGDSTVSTYGGGAWASRGIICGGEAALKAARDLAANILTVAAAISQRKAEDLELRNGAVVVKATGAVVSTLGEVANIAYFRQDTLPPGVDPQFMVTRSHVTNDKMYYVTSGVQASYLEVDPETGFIKLLGHWAVTDCGRQINPLLVDEQMRGGIVQGIGSVLYEECIYDAQGNLANSTMAEYLAPMAFEMPDIQLDSIETREGSTELGAKGVGESGLIGAMGAVWVAMNDALFPFNARMTVQPFTPERVLDAIRGGKLESGRGLS